MSGAAAVVENGEKGRADVTGGDLRGSRLQARYLVVFACFVMGAVSYLMRVNLSVAIVAMTDGGTTSDLRAGPVYDWDSTTRGTVLSSFFWGYVVTQIPGGYLAQRYGPRNVLLVTMLLSSVATFLFVPAAALGWEYACAARAVLGLVQGGLLPCFSTIVAHWGPPSERGRMAVYAFSGNIFGTVVGLSGTGFLAATEMGWPLVFYVVGGLGLASTGLWWWLGANSPAEHRLASPREVRYIEESLRAGVGDQRDDPAEHLPTPWRAILTSVPVWALLTVQCVNAWGFWTLLTEIPSYMSGVLQFELAKNGLLSALPYLTQFVCGFLFSWLTDWLLKKGLLSVNVSRKLSNSIGHYGAALALVVLGYVSANEAAAVAILTVTVGISAATMVGHSLNHMDLSPNFTGTIMGITNCAANSTGIIAPLLVGLIVTEIDNAAQWRVVFLIASGLYVVGNTVFVVFGSVEIQPWNQPQWRRTKTHSESDSSTNSSREIPTKIN